MADEAYAERLDALAQTREAWARIGAGLTDADWARPTRCSGWHVAALYAHHAAFPRALSAPPPLPPGPVPDPVTATEVLRRFNAPGGLATTMAPAVAAGAVAAAAGASAAELVDRFAVTGPEAIATLRRAPASAVVPWPAAEAPVTLTEALRIVLLEATVHLLDLTAALDRPPAAPPAALRTTVHLLAEIAPEVAFVEAATGRAKTSVLPIIR